MSLKKITLEKSSPSVSLKKTGDNFGEIVLNLNWSQGEQKRGFFGGGGKNIDLDLGVVAADSHQFFEGKVISGQDYFFNVLYIFQQHCSSSSLQDKHMVYGMYGSSITKERISKGIGCLFAGKGQPAR